MRDFWHANRPLFLVLSFFTILGWAASILMVLLGDPFVLLLWVPFTVLYTYAVVSECKGKDYWFLGEWMIASIRADKSVDKQDDVR